ncbi:MAG: hypothetical protein A2X08_14085 [Bacteroidetes bacterium GWA2_32_17]|nr:MAG: hypothetical protein A2X08_14085 [Bacteroidetes bacterium GWA2_32_17]
MKKYFFIFIMTFTINAQAQVIFEHDYDSAATYNNCFGNFSQLMIIKFEVSGEKYVKVNRCGKVIVIYNLNHSLVKTISLSGVPLDNGVVGDILYLSETLFDTDSSIEFMYTVFGVGYYITNIYKENGSFIFSDTGSVMVHPNYEMQQYPIYNTSQGTKMILSYKNGHAKVFSLAGTLSTSIEQANGQLMQAQNGQFSNLYPNPSNGSVTLQYELPKNETEGELILYNMQGTEVKRYKVDNTFKDILLDNKQLAAGTYFYQLQTKKGAVGTKKMIVIK